MQLIKKNGYIVTAVLFIATAMFAAFGFTSSAYAAETEGTPMIYCEYTDSDGNAVDGNSLAAGTYDVSFYTTGFSTISVIEITAAYDTSVVTVNSVKNQISTMESMGSVTDNGDLVVGFVSNGDYVSVDSSAQLIATVNVTIAAVEGVDAVDAADYIVPATEPNLTFVVTDSTGGNYTDEYALVDTFEGYEGNISLMTCDITPAFTAAGYDISGQIQIANSTTGSSSGFGLVGITVSVLNGDTTIATAVTDSSGNYTLSGVPAGTYTMSISGPTTIDRRVTLVVSDTKTVQPVGIIMADYNRDGGITGTDIGVYLESHGNANNYNVYCDYNADGGVTATDIGQYLTFHGQKIAYDEVTLN